MAARIEKDLDERVEIKPGARGQLDVTVDGNVVASRQQRIAIGNDGYPDEQATLDAVHRALGA